MKKRYLTLVLLLFWGATQTFAQKASVNFKEEKEKKKQENDNRKTYVELGVNVTGAIASAGFRQADSLQNSDPFFLHLKLVSHRFGVRLGAGTSTLSKKKISEIDSRIQSVTASDFRLGLDYQIPIDNRWRIYAGFDLISGYKKGQNDYSNAGGITKIRYTEKSIGGGPLLGLQFHLNKRISLQTEAALYLVNTTTEKNLSYSDIKVPPSNSSGSNWTMPIGVPRSMFVIIRF
jgi:Outer membrane protein beta-barrel domain